MSLCGQYFAGESPAALPKAVQRCGGIVKLFFCACFLCELGHGLGTRPRLHNNPRPRVPSEANHLASPKVASPHLSTVRYEFFVRAHAGPHLREDVASLQSSRIKEVADLRLPEDDLS